MDTINTVLPYVQLVLSVLLITAILMQTRGSSVGGAFGGDDGGTTYYMRRGAEKILFQATIALSLVFAAAAFVAIFI